VEYDKHAIIEMTEKNKPFFRQVADEMLDAETARHIEEQEAALRQHPDWADGHYHLAQLYRVQQRPDLAKRELLTAIEKDPALADAHVALGEIYITEDDLERAREHAEFAAAFGNRRLLDQMQRWGVAGRPPE
jgi:tetratricopeptide (TPR) repeat protein